MSVNIHDTGLGDLVKVTCACGRPIADHKCPSSQGYAPRAPKTDICRACGEKAHQNQGGVPARLECLWRQYAKARGALAAKTGKFTRLQLPVPDAANIADFAQWVASGGVSSNPDGTFLAPDTAAVLKRMQARAANAAPMPDETPADAPTAQDDVTATTDTITLSAAPTERLFCPVHDGSSGPCYSVGPCRTCGNTVYECDLDCYGGQYCSEECPPDDGDDDGAQHPSGCDDGCTPDDDDDDPRPCLMCGHGPVSDADELMYGALVCSATCADSLARVRADALPDIALDVDLTASDQPVDYSDLF